MVGRRDANLRSGDLSEDFGIHLLRTFALVAQVPRTEDAGIDAVCTLQKLEGDRTLVSDASFYVQIKSRSVRRVEYAGADYEWFAALDLPFFIASVDRSSGELELFTTEPARHQLVHHMRRVVLHLDQPAERGYKLDKFSARVGEGEAVACHRWLGEPVFKVRLPTGNVRAAIGEAHAVLAPWIQHVRRAAELRRNDIWMATDWDGTGAPPRCAGGPLIAAHPRDALALVEQMKPLLIKLALSIGYDQVWTEQARPEDKPAAMLLYYFLRTVYPDDHPLPPPPGEPNPPGSHWVMSGSERSGDGE